MTKHQRWVFLAQFLRLAIWFDPIALVVSSDNENLSEDVSNNHADMNSSSKLTTNYDDLRKAVEATLTEHANIKHELSLLDQGETRLRESLVSVQQQHVELIELTRDVGEILRNKVNVMALRYLQDELARIRAQEIEARDETMKRARAAEMEVKQKMIEQSQKSPVVTSKEELLQLLSHEKAFEQSDARLEEWCRQIFKEAIEELTIPEIDIKAHIGGNDNDISSKDLRSCALPSQAAQIIQMALAEYKQDKLYDHASNGAWIVHEMTSESFQPKDIVMSGKETDKKSSWWMQHIPDDWIDAITYFNENYVDVPDQGGDTFFNLLSDFASRWSFSKATVNPPETVLHPLVLPGSCWPLRGRNGFLTIALPYSISLSAISIDHVNQVLLLNGDISSAPKKINVIGYPPCTDKNCKGLTFDVKDPFQVLEFEFDVHSGAYSRTMSVEYVENTTNNKGGNNINVSGDGGSCAATDPNNDDDDDDDHATAITSCNAGLIPSSTIERNDHVAALRFEFLENHGNEDYTCIYRIRVHGQVVA